MQVISVLDAMPSSNLKPESEEVELDQSRVYRTTYMFSATMPSAVERLARKYLRRPVVINIGSAGKATDNVQQRVIVVKVQHSPRPSTHMRAHALTAVSCCHLCQSACGLTTTSTCEPACACTRRQGAC